MHGGDPSRPSVNSIAPPNPIRDRAKRLFPRRGAGKLSTTLAFITSKYTPTDERDIQYTPIKMSHIARRAATAASRAPRASQTVVRRSYATTEKAQEQQGSDMLRKAARRDPELYVRHAHPSLAQHLLTSSTDPLRHHDRRLRPRRLALLPQSHELLLRTIRIHGR